MTAYLILAHGQFGLLEKLIRMLDNPENDIFVHIDKKASDFCEERFRNIAKHSSVYFTQRVGICWGGYSIVEAEYILIKSALSGGKKYKYLHLISGVDLPIKTADEINAFFDKAYPKEFVHFSAGMNKVEISRIKHYHFFPGRRNVFNRALTKAEQLLQSALRIDKTHGMNLARGSQWFSITGTLAEYLAENEKKMKKLLKHTFIPDEFFVQTAVVNSHFKDNLYYPSFDDDCRQNMRYIDWQRGNPYTFRENDFDEIMSSECLFVRKLDQSNKLPDMIFQRFN